MTTNSQGLFLLVRQAGRGSRTELRLPFPSQTLSASKVKDHHVRARLSAHRKVLQPYETVTTAALQVSELRYGDKGLGSLMLPWLSQTGREHGRKEQPFSLPCEYPSTQPWVQLSGKNFFLKKEIDRHFAKSVAMGK